MALCNISFISHGNIVKRFPSRFLMLLVVFKEISHVNGQDESLLVYANDDIRLSCSPTSLHPPGWQHLRDGNKKPVKLSLENKLLGIYASNGRFNLSIDPQQRRYDLLINRVVTGDAGIYTCNEDRNKRRFKLTVQKRVTKLLQSPTNTAVLSGKDARLNCSTSYSAHVYWQHTPADHPQTLRGVYYCLPGLQGQYKTNRRYAVIANESIGQYDLMIRNATPSDAGRFTCLDNDGEGEKVSAELIVSGSVPTCVSNSTPDGAILANNKCGLDADFIKLTCNVTYYGHQPPMLEWFIGNISADEFPQTNYSSTHQATTEIILEAQEWMQSTPIYCRITESPWNNMQECSSPVKLHEFSYAREAVSISNISSSGIKCDAGSTGECVYEWKDEKGEIVMQGQLLQPTQQIVVLPGKYTCFSTCDIGGLKCTKVSWIFTLESTTVREIPSWIYAMVGMILLMTTIIIAILECCRITNIIRTFYRWRHKTHRRKDANMQANEGVPLNVLVPSNSTGDQHNLILLDKFGGDRDEHIRGIAVLNTNVYLIRNQAKHIEVYNYESGTFKTNETNIEVKDFSKVRYMAACSLNHRIYISDEDIKTIHTVQYNSEDETPNESKYEVGSFLVDQEPEGLSVTHAGNIVITFQRVRKLGIYNMFGTHMRCIDLPESISHPWYAEEITNNEFLVRHDVEEDIKYLITKVKVQSAEINASSNVSISYKDPKWRGARSFARTEDGSVFLADFMQHEIRLLDPNLEFVEVIAPELHWPARVCYDKTRHYLYVTNHSTKDVYAFQYCITHKSE